MNGHKQVILITGGLGNLGAWMTDHFANKEDYDVYVLAKSDRNILVDHPFKKIFCDITDLEQLRASLAGISPEYIIHLASFNETFSDNYALKALLINSLGTRNLLECSEGWSVKKFIYFSTFHVYGKSVGLITELNTPGPLNDYAITHLFAEEYVRMFAEKCKLPYIILRLSNSYGCPKDRNSSKWYLLFNDLCRQAVVNRAIHLKTNGLAVRDFISMKDVCTAVERVMLHQSISNEIFNLGSGMSYSLIQIAEYVKEAFYEEYGEVILVSKNEQDKNKYPVSLNFDVNKLRKHISFNPGIFFKDEAKKIFRITV